MEEIINALSNYGFPIVISFYLLIRMESKIDELSKQINKLSESILKTHDKDL